MLAAPFALACCEERKEGTTTSAQSILRNNQGSELTWQSAGELSAPEGRDPVKFAEHDDQRIAGERPHPRMTPDSTAKTVGFYHRKHIPSENDPYSHDDLGDRVDYGDASDDT